ncbi:MAG: hypothetical protein ABIO24_01140 [Saprospiraceae bacterium]
MKKGSFPFGPAKVGLPGEKRKAAGKIFICFPRPSLGLTAFVGQKKPKAAKISPKKKPGAYSGVIFAARLDTTAGNFGKIYFSKRLPFRATLFVSS